MKCFKGVEWNEAWKTKPNHFVRGHGDFRCCGVHIVFNAVKRWIKSEHVVMQ